MKKKELKKRQIVLFAIGLVMFLTGFGILSFMGVRKIRRDIHRQKLMKENTVLEIPELHIKAPVLEGVGLDVLAEAAGHFPDTGAIGQGNYCIAGHSSVIYKEDFNNLKHAQNGMEIKLSDAEGHQATYYVAETKIVNPDETWILDESDDCRVTIVTCTDDGSQRFVVVGKQQQSDASNS